jgi:hypothetical protein
VPAHHATHGASPAAAPLPKQTTNPDPYRDALRRLLNSHAEYRQKRRKMQEQNKNKLFAAERLLIAREPPSKTKTQY